MAAPVLLTGVEVGGEALNFVQSAYVGGCALRAGRVATGALSSVPRPVRPFSPRSGHYSHAPQSLAALMRAPSLPASCRLHYIPMHMRHLL